VQDFRLLRLGMHEDLRPRGAYESVLVERYIVNQWRTQRCAIMEAELIAHRREYATAWANPRRVKVTPTAGAVWGDDQQFYGGALEKLAKYEYRLSLEANRVLRELAQRQKAREEDQGGDDFMARLDALREKKPTAGEPQMTQIDTDELLDKTERQFNLRESAKSAVPNPSSHAAEPTAQSGNLQNELSPREARRTAGPRNSRMDTDELPGGDKREGQSVSSVQSVDEVALGHATEPTLQSGNLQNELPPHGGKVNAATKEAQPEQGKPRRAPYDTDKLRAEIERRVNRHLTAQAGALSPLRQGVAPRLKATSVGSGA